MKQRASEELGAIWAEIEAAEEEDALAEMGEGGAGMVSHDLIVHLVPNMQTCFRPILLCSDISSRFNNIECK